MSLIVSGLAHAGNGTYKSALVLDYSNGQVLYQSDSHRHVDPASLVKMMVMLIAMEELKKGTVGLDDRCVISSKAARIGGHQVYLKQGEVFAFEELLKAVFIASANDAAYAVAEHIAGSQEAYVTRMNATARRLGMQDTRFVNAHGLPPNRGGEHNQSSAHDLAILARELMRYPKVMAWAGTRKDTFRNGSMELLNTNHRFLQRFEGADGFKTGYHPRGAGFSMVATASRDGRRLLAVILGAETSRARLQSATRLLELGFKNQLQRTAALD